MTVSAGPDARPFSEPVKTKHGKGEVDRGVEGRCRKGVVNDLLFAGVTHNHRQYWDRRREPP